MCRFSCSEIALDTSSPRHHIYGYGPFFQASIQSIWLSAFFSSFYAIPGDQNSKLQNFQEYFWSWCYWNRPGLALRLHSVVHNYMYLVLYDLHMICTVLYKIIMICQNFYSDLSSISNFLGEDVQSCFFYFEGYGMCFCGWFSQFLKMWWKGYIDDNFISYCLLYVLSWPILTLVFFSFFFLFFVDGNLSKTKLLLFCKQNCEVHICFWPSLTVSCICEMQVIVEKAERSDIPNIDKKK